MQIHGMRGRDVLDAVELPTEIQEISKDIHRAVNPGIPHKIVVGETRNQS